LGFEKYEVRCCWVCGVGCGVVGWWPVMGFGGCAVVGLVFVWCGAVEERVLFGFWV